MRLRVVIALLVLLLAATPAGLAQQDGTHAVLDLDVQLDHTEKLTLTFTGLRKLTQYQGICLPERARETKVHDDLGDVPYEGKDEDGRRVISFLARGSSLVIDMERSAPAATDHPLYAADANFCVPAQADVTMNVLVPEGHTLFFLSAGGKITNGRSGTVSAGGPTHVFYSYEAPLAGRIPLEIFDEGVFRIFVAPALAAQAREVASLATAPLTAALAEAGLDRPFDTIRVRYAPETPFPWEAGHYNGHGYVQVKDDALVEDATKGYPVSSVKVLVHESFHAASFPHGKGVVEDSVSWFLEGTARHSERHVDRAMPNASTYCEKDATEVKCFSFDDRIERSSLDAGYDPKFTFDVRWEPSLPQDDATRRFYYGYSEYVVEAWIEQHGVPAYQALWEKVLSAFEEGADCPCKSGWLLGLLGDDGIFHPYADLRSSDPDAFSKKVEPYVKDEEALQRELDKQANPLSGLGVPLAPWVALLALGAVALARRR